MAAVLATEPGCIRLLDAAHQQLGGSIVLIRDTLDTHAPPRWPS